MLSKSSPQRQKWIKEQFGVLREQILRKPLSNTWIQSVLTAITPIMHKVVCTVTMRGPSLSTFYALFSFDPHHSPMRWVPLETGARRGTQLASCRIWPQTLVLNPNHRNVQSKRTKKPNTLELRKDNQNQVLCCALSIVHLRTPGEEMGLGGPDQVLKRQTAWVRSWGLLPLSRCITSLLLASISSLTKWE